MKDLTAAEFKDAPNVIQFIYVASLSKQPIGIQMFETALKEHPEYFPDELEYRRKWASIPPNVHDEYWDAKEKLHQEVFKDMPESKGILGWIKDPNGYEDWHKAYDKFRGIEKPLEKELHDKYYKKYGIEYAY